MTPVSRVIDGFTFTLSPLPTMAALELVPQLTELFSEPLEKLKLGEGSDALFPALAALMRTNPKKLVQLTRALLQGCVVRTPEGTEGLLMPQVDVLLAGKVLTLLKVAVFAVEVHHGDFFAELRKRLAALGAKKKGDLHSALEKMLSNSGPPSA